MSEPLRDEAPPLRDERAPEGERDEGLRDEDVRDEDVRDEDGPQLPPPTAVESLVHALLEAGPEVTEHVVRAAQELLLAAQVVVDAADRAIQEQQEVRDARGERTDEDAPRPRRLDIAE